MEFNTLLLIRYAPSGVRDQEALFTELGPIIATAPRPLLLSGDFNCTLGPLINRLYLTPLLDHDSKALRSLLSDCVLVYALDDQALRAWDEKEVDAFYQQHHTYHYTLAGGQHASSRLDRS